MREKNTRKYNIFCLPDHSIQSCCWVALQNYPVPRNYQLNATVDLTPRANRGNQTNSSPTASIVPVQFVQQSCNHVIRIPGKQFFQSLMVYSFKTNFTWQPLVMLQENIERIDPMH